MEEQLRESISGRFIILKYCIFPPLDVVVSTPKYHLTSTKQYSTEEPSAFKSRVQMIEVIIDHTFFTVPQLDYLSVQLYMSYSVRNKVHLTI